MTLVDNGQISRTDIENKLKEIRGDVDTATESAKSVGLVIAVAVVVAVVGIAFLTGRRRGRKLSTVVEIRRVG
jgi:hypothetical protein